MWEPSPVPPGDLLSKTRSSCCATYSRRHGIIKEKGWVAFSETGKKWRVARRAERILASIPNSWEPNEGSLYEFIWRATTCTQVYAERNYTRSNLRNCDSLLRSCILGRQNFYRLHSDQCSDLSPQHKIEVVQSCPGSLQSLIPQGFYICIQVFPNIPPRHATPRHNSGSWTGRKKVR